MKKQNRVIALLLCVCLLLGMIPSMAFAIDWMTYDVEVILKEDDVNERWDIIKKQVEDATGDQTVLIRVVGKAEIPEPLQNTNGAIFCIEGEGNTPTIIPKAGKEAEKKFQDEHLLSFESSSGSPGLYIRNLTLDGDDKAGLLSVSGYGDLWFGSDDKVPTPTANVIFQNGRTGMGKAGSVRIEEVPHVVMRNCWFKGNKGNLNSANTGCLYYSMKGELADSSKYSAGMYLDACKFIGNEAHSGGAMYVYGNSAYAYVGPDCYFVDNYTTQRGGAIHCHGTVNVDNSVFERNHSDGMGGTFYVSAGQVESPTVPGQRDNYYGVLVLSGRPAGHEQGFDEKHEGTGLTITGSNAGTDC